MTLSNKMHLSGFYPPIVALGQHMSSSAEPPGLADRWLSVDDIAAYLGVKRDTVYKWIVRAGMPAHKVGRLWKFRKSEIDVWVCSKQTRSVHQEKE